MSFRAINPLDGAVGAERGFSTVSEVDAQIVKAVDAFQLWRNRSVDERCLYLTHISDLLLNRKDEMSVLMAEEMGKPLVQGRSEVEKCAWVCRHYADHAVSYMTQEYIVTDGSSSGVRYDPLGVIFAIMPWNFPLWQVFRWLAPTLAGGNVGVLKHAPGVPGCAAAVEAIVAEAGVPEGVFQHLWIGVETVPTVIGHGAVAGVTLTGSTRAGRAVAEVAGRHLKPVVLELGGSDACVILDDADVEEAVRVSVWSRILNNGQSCIASKRFLVTPGIYDEFVERFSAAMGALRVGDPQDPKTEVGPLARVDLAVELRRQIRASVEQGARAVVGGAAEHELGAAFVAPTVLTEVEPGMPAFDEELFGPCAAIVAVRDADHALELANRSAYGLGASVWTEGPDAARFVRELEAGAVFVNGIVKSDPRLPFGGIRDSGMGRELGRAGMLAFMNAKTFWVR